MADQTPKAIVSSKCIAYSEALLLYRRSVVTDPEAIQYGRDLFAWFQAKGALADAEKAQIAARSVDLGITLLKAGSETVDRISTCIRDAYQGYA
jgi:hypothetical protein